MRLSQMRIGQTGRIVKIHSSTQDYRKRLIAMGLIPGSIVSLSRIAPLGDPIQITTRGFCLALRKKEAHVLEIEEC